MKCLALAVASLAFCGLACGKGITATCSTVEYHTLFVTAKDSISGALVPNAVLKATGPFSDSVSIGPNVSAYPVSLAGAAGVYTVTVQATGYSTWTKTVTVTLSGQSDCGGQPNIVSITALLEKTP